MDADAILAANQAAAVQQPRDFADRVPVLDIVERSS